jgi:hypothetical protein
MQFALVNKSRRLDDGFVSFVAKACDAQVAECAAAWGVDPVPVAFYARETDLPARDCYIVALVDDIDPGMLGFHDDVAGVIYARVLAQDEHGTSVTASHEFLETLIDPTCDKWRPIAGGNRLTALEVCDAVEDVTYDAPTTIMGETRAIRLSDYLTPRWFDPQANGGAGPFDRQGALGAPFTMAPGGYMLVRDRGSNDVQSVFARDGQPRMAAKRRNPDSRLHRRGAGV